MRYIGVLVLLLAFTASAQAESSVDWSQFVESGPPKQLIKTHPDKKVAASPTKAKARVAKAKAKPAKRKIKARSKKKSGRRR